MSFPEGPPAGEEQHHATDGRDAEGTAATASPEDAPAAALRSEDPSADGESRDEDPQAVESSGEATERTADLENADRDQTDREDRREQRASQPGGALGPGTTATGAGTALD